jgi:hypothetical protein
MCPIYLRVAEGTEHKTAAPSGSPQLIKVDVEPGDAAFKKLMRNKVVVRVEIDGLGRKIFTVKAKGRDDGVWTTER